MILIFIAELFCNHAMITGNHSLNVVETTLWNIALGMLIPDTLTLFLRSKQIFGNHDQIDGSQVIRFTLYCLVIFSVFIVQTSIDYLPTQYRLWYEGEQMTDNPHKYEFWPGLISTIKERNVTQSYEAWQDDMFWMFSYFWFGVWLTIYIAQAPRLHLK